MRLRCLVLLALSAAFGAGCVTNHGHFDHDPAASFGGYHNYAFVHPEPPPEGKGIPLPMGDIARSQLIDQRVEAAIQRELAVKGLELAPFESADLIVAYSASSRTASRTEYYPDGGGPYWPYGWWYAHWDQVYTRLYTEGVLIVDLIDAKTRRLVWRGWTTDPLPADDMSGVVDHAVHEIFKNYPPPAPKGGAPPARR
jgi:hypothetical protein